MPNYVGGDGVPSAISFSDQKILSDKNRKELTSKKEPELKVDKGGVFKKPKDTPKPKDTTKPTKPTQMKEPVAAPKKGLLQKVKDFL